MTAAACTDCFSGANCSTDDPIMTALNLRRPQQLVDQVTGNYTTDADDRVINVTAASVTVTLTANATLGDHVTILAPDAGDVTVAAQSPATIDGTSTLITAGTAGTYWFRPGATCDDPGTWIPEKDPAAPIS